MLSQSIRIPSVLILTCSVGINLAFASAPFKPPGTQTRLEHRLKIEPDNSPHAALLAGLACSGFALSAGIGYLFLRPRPTASPPETPRSKALGDLPLLACAVTVASTILLLELILFPPLLENWPTALIFMALFTSAVLNASRRRTLSE